MSKVKLVGTHGLKCDIECKFRHNKLERCIRLNTNKEVCLCDIDIAKLVKDVETEIDQVLNS